MNIHTAGLILMVIGVAGLVIGLFLMTVNRDRAVVVDDRPVDPRYR